MEYVYPAMYSSDEQEGLFFESLFLPFCFLSDYHFLPNIYCSKVGRNGEKVKSLSFIAIITIGRIGFAGCFLTWRNSANIFICFGFGSKNKLCVSGLSFWMTDHFYGYFVENGALFEIACVFYMTR